MKWFIITGRIPFDDEDTLEIIQAEDRTKAFEEFERRLRAAGPASSDDIIIVHSLECDTEPRAI
jgi:enamine deaminase RidA (YjgF/YER057c/UK114 family)